MTENDLFYAMLSLNVLKDKIKSMNVLYKIEYKYTNNNK